MVVLRPEHRERKSNYQVPPEVVSTLRSTPWCASLLDDPAYVPLVSHSRMPPSYLAGRYSWMGKTLKTPDTIAIWQDFYRRPTSDDDYGEIRTIISLGSGMDGHKNTAHGGLAATLLDESMGTVGSVHKEPGKSQFTAYLHVDYKKPLPTPSVVLIKAKIDPVRSGGRKMYIKATLEDGQGTVYNAADGLFLEVERKPHPSKL